MRAMHEWRKRVKDLRYAAEMLERAEPPHGLLRGGSRSGGARVPSRSEVAAPARASRADELGELLGEEHDLAVLAHWLKASGEQAGIGRRTRRRLLKAIARRRTELRRRAIRDGRRLYKRSPGAFMARVSRAYARCSPKLS